MGKALYRKYRSRSLDEIVGQDHVTGLLKRALERGRVAHAYLFTGLRGVGKTSIARILAHEINNLPYSDESTHLDIIEIDAASNNGVDDIRDLRDKVQLAPVSAKKKVYIIDEVHMLSKPAFNALLKTLEEPPEHVVFILATTDVEKLPETIISRTQRHTFRRASIKDLVANMRRIAKHEKISIDDEALALIAEHSDGGYRDSVSLLDQLANIVDENGTVTATLVEQSLGLAAHTQLAELLQATKKGDLSTISSHLRALESRGIQAKTIAMQLVRLIRDTAVDSGELLPLMGDLIEVGQSSLPQAKLLATLGSFASMPHLSFSQNEAATSEMMVSAPFSRRSTSEEQPVASLANTNEATARNATEGKTVAKSASSRNETSDSNTSSNSDGDATKKSEKSSKKSLSIADVNWQKFTEDIRSGSIGLYSVLSKCAYSQDKDTIIIYTKNDFYKKKLDKPKALAALQTALQKQTECDWEITLVAGTKPHRDSQTAAVAAMMGGGEEVELDD